MFCSGMGNTCAVVVTLCPGKLTGIWTAEGGNPGPKALAGMVTAAEPPGTVMVCGGTYIVSAGKMKLGASSRRNHPAFAFTCGQ